MPPGRRSHSVSESAGHGLSHESTSSPPASSGAETAASPNVNSSKNTKRSKTKGKKGAVGSSTSNDPTKEEQAVSTDPTKARFMREIAYSEMERSLMRAYFQVSAESIFFLLGLSTRMLTPFHHVIDV